jgi:hypothetical protein
VLHVRLKPVKPHYLIVFAVTELIAVFAELEENPRRFMMMFKYYVEMRPDPATFVKVYRDVMASLEHGTALALLNVADAERQKKPV